MLNKSRKTNIGLISNILYKGTILPDFQHEHRNINDMFSRSNSDNLSM